MRRTRQCACPVCDYVLGIMFTTYKHRWICCKRCRNISRVRRPRYPLGRLSYVLLSRLLPDSALEMLYPSPEIREVESRFYEYYSDVSASNFDTSKWRGVYENLVRHFNDNLDYNFADKRLLDVSGGPGFIAKKLTDDGAQVVVTEFSARSVAGMKRNLDLDAVTFDYNNDVLDDKVEGKFDVVLIMASINFCRDIRAFVQSIRRVCAPEAIIYVTFTEPSLGTCLRWQFDEYTYNVLYHPRLMDEAFLAGGFHLIHRHTDALYKWNEGFSGKLNLIRMPISTFYRAFASIGPRGFPHDPYQYASFHTYRFAGPPPR